MLVVIMIILIDNYSDMFDLAPVPTIILYIWLLCFWNDHFLTLSHQHMLILFLYSVSWSLFFYTIKFRALVSFIMYLLSSLEIYFQLLYTCLLLHWIFLEPSSISEQLWLAGCELSFTNSEVSLLPEICTQQNSL